MDPRVALHLHQPGRQNGFTGGATRPWPALTVDQVLTPESMRTAAERLTASLAAGEAQGDYRRIQTLELEMYRSDGEHPLDRGDHIVSDG